MKRRDAEYRPPPTLVGGGFSRVASSLNVPSILSSTACPVSHIFNASVLSYNSASTSPLYPACPSGCRDRDRVVREEMHDALPSKTEFQRSADDVPLSSWTSVRKEMSS
jgi:hypothetical protein